MTSLVIQISSREAEALADIPILLGYAKFFQIFLLGCLAAASFEVEAKSVTNGNIDLEGETTYTFDALYTTIRL